MVEYILKNPNKPRRGRFNDYKDLISYLGLIGLCGNLFETADGRRIPLVFEPEPNLKI